mmetsp:Transcript_26801/g.62844  ORF Transcript_26801/g.62844 Transcript_26801/m.62844 type:complete len:322 (-) Transcript_26801:269-1234(-)
MEEDKKFKSKDELEDWLKSRGVDEDDVADAAEKLLANRFNRPSKLLGISVEMLLRQGLSDATAMGLSNKLKEQQWQQQKQVGDEDDNILGPGVYDKLTGAVCFFADEENNPIGAGFAISSTTVYSVAHNFPQSAVGMEMLCRFGKPNQRLVRRLRISAIDHRLDYCILRTVPGEVDLPNFLDTSRAALETGRNCILAAFQIGIQNDLKHLDPDLSVGIFKGEISKLYPRHFVYQCPSFAGDSGGAVVLKNGNVIGIHQETVIQARERIQHREDLETDARLESVEASIDELLRSLSSGSIGLRVTAITEPKSSFEESHDKRS